MGKALMQFRLVSVDVRNNAIQYIEQIPLDAKRPLVVQIIEDNVRSSNQNRLQHQWYRDMASQGDQCAEDYRRYCKLHYGVPILRADDDYFREQYDRVIKPMEYERKLDFMTGALEIPVTSIMTVEQMTRFLDAVWVGQARQGFRLTDPAFAGLEVY